MGITTTIIDITACLKVNFKISLHKNKHRGHPSMSNFSCHNFYCLIFCNRKIAPQKIHQKILDGLLPFQKHIKKWAKNTQKCPKQRDDNIISDLSQGMMEYTCNRQKNPCKIPPAER